MRLIDADKINFLEIFGGMSEYAKDVRRAAQELIDRQPTVYDLDKVIDQLEIEEDLALKRYADCHTYALPATYVRYKTRYEEIRNCLKIVKSGICPKVEEKEETSEN